MWPHRTGTPGACFQLSVEFILVPNIDPVKEMRPALCLCFSYLFFPPPGQSWCSLTAAVAMKWIFLFFVRDNRADFLLRELSAPSWTNRLYFTDHSLCGRSAALHFLSPERAFCVSLDGLVGVQSEKVSVCICMRELLAWEGSEFADTPDVLPEGNRCFETMNIFLQV